MPSKSSAPSLSFQVPCECSVGVLYPALHREQALTPVQVEIEERARAVGLFDDTGVDFVLLHAEVNTPTGARRVQATGVVVDKRWRKLDKETYSAHVDVDLTAWTPKSRERTPEQALAGAMPILVYAGWLGFAQAAVELGVALERVAQFLAGSPVSPDALKPRSARRQPRATRKEPLLIQVLFRADHPNDQLFERQRLDEVLAHAAVRGKLGTCEGSSSSDEHFEFAFSVPDRTKAQRCFLEALATVGVDRDSISFHTEQ